MTAFRINGSTDLTFADMTITHFTLAFKCENNSSTGLEFLNLSFANNSRYAIWGGNPRSSVVIRDCVSEGTLTHAIRLYSDNTTITNCSTYGTSGTGLWLAEGDNVNVTRYSAQQRIKLGPDHSAESGIGAELTNVNARALASDNNVDLEMGLKDACIVNMCADLRVGRVTTDFPLDPNRPMIDVHWDSYSGSFTQATNPNYTNVGSVSYNYCFEDIAGATHGLPDNVVDVTDLLAVISAWGACPAAPVTVTRAHPPCPADVAPEICGDRVVNVSDLLAVISAWGECPSNPACGALAARNGQFSEGPPQSLDDCYDDCIAAFPNGGEKFIECYNACVEALCRAQIINCD